MKFKTRRADKFEMTPEMVPHLRALVQLCAADAEVSKVIGLHVNRRPAEGEVLGGSVELMLMREVELSEEEMRNLIDAGQAPGVHGLVSEE